jgi:outer membrane cobalamin receptor
MGHSGLVLAEEGDDADALEEVVVTGSRIKRTLNSASQEVITITAEDMRITGDISVADALRSSNLNSLALFGNHLVTARSQMQRSIFADWARLAHWSL